MDDALSRLLTELEQFGLANDAPGAERSQRMLNITRDTGELLAVLVCATQAKNILEIGTSNGYSTLWLADAASRINGSVTTIEFAPAKVALASANFARSGLAPVIHQIEGDAGPALAEFDDGEFDLLFLDSDRAQYAQWWPHIARVLRSGGLLVVDNAASHAAEMASFCALVRQEADFVTALVPVGKGEFLATKAGQRPAAVNL